MTRKRRRFRNRLRRDDSGQGFVEYILIIALVALGLVVALSVYRNHIGQTLDDVGTSVATVGFDQYQPGAEAGGSSGGTSSGGTSSGGTSSGDSSSGGSSGDWWSDFLDWFCSTTGWC